jgi:hypothetical protein
MEMTLDPGISSSSHIYSSTSSIQRNDRLIFKKYDGKRDHTSYTAHLQLYFQCDADLGGNLDNDHSQTSYVGYLGSDLKCWGSTDQGSVSSSTAESEIKAVANALKAEIIAFRGILNTMGWIQDPTSVEENNAACVYACNSLHMTHNLRHLESWTPGSRRKSLMVPLSLLKSIP